MTATQHEFFYVSELKDDYIVLQLGDALYKLPRRQLRVSEFWSDLFDLPQRTESLEGQDDEHPMALNLPGDLEAVDFDRLFCVLYPSFELNTLPNSPMNNSPSYEYWLSVLKLSTAWVIPAIRLSAIGHLSDSQTRIEQESIAQILFAMHPLISVQTWLIDGCVAFMSKPNSLALAGLSVCNEHRFLIAMALELEYWRKQPMIPKARSYSWGGELRANGVSIRDRLNISLGPVLLAMEQHAQVEKIDPAILAGEYYVGR